MNTTFAAIITVIALLTLGCAAVLAVLVGAIVVVEKVHPLPTEGDGE